MCRHGGFDVQVSGAEAPGSGNELSRRHSLRSGDPRRRQPRLFGSAEQILLMSRAKPGLWSAVLRAAENGSPPAALRARTRGFASLVTNDPRFARAAIADALKIVAKGLSTEHVEFEQRMWPVAETYDACCPWLSADERTTFIDYLNRMFDANNAPGVDSFGTPFHNTHRTR